jgi:ribose 5-phosphate isomerase A
MNSNKLDPHYLDMQKQVCAANVIIALKKKIELQIKDSHLHKNNEPEILKIGLGTGSTINHLIAALKTHSFNCPIEFYSTSKASSELAEKAKLVLKPMYECSFLDICIDGADAVDFNHNLLKGFGGALTKEKIAALLAKELWILVDESKLTTKLSIDKIPVEIIPDSLGYVQKELLLKKISSQQRIEKEFCPYLTDSGNWIIYLNASYSNINLKDLAQIIKGITGVVEHGLFLDFPVTLFNGLPIQSVNNVFYQIDR